MRVATKYKNNYMILYLPTFLGFLVVVQSALKPVPDTIGTSYVFSIPYCSEEEPPNMYIVPQVTEAVNLTLTSYETKQQISMPVGSALRHPLHCRESLQKNNTTTAFRLIATNEITLYIDHTESTYIVYPEDTLSTQYTVVTMVTSVFDTAFFTIAGNYTILAIELPSSLESSLEINETYYTPGAKLNMYLAEDETLLVSCMCDLTGIKITSSLPVSVNVGSRNSSNSKMCLIQQLLPDSAWGRRFVFSQHKWMSDNITLKIIAKQKQTDVSLILKDRTISASISEQLKMSMHISVSDFIAIEADKSIMCLVLFEVLSGLTDAHHSMLALSPVLLFHVRSSFVSVGSPSMSVNFIVSSESFSHVSFNESSEFNPFTRPMIYFWNYFLCQNIELNSPYSVRVSDENITPLFAMVFLRNASNVRIYPLGMRVTAIYDACVTTVIPYGGNGDGMDNDCDNSIDEEQLNNKDDDGDGLVDEDIVYSGVIRAKPVDMAWEYYQKKRAENQETGIATSVVSILISIGVGLSGVGCFIGFMFLIDKLKQRYSGHTRVGPCP